ncbi:MAG: hypothetical protein J2P21_05245 [Chloracidobacterium sp.]|nr:hypothetical protein [Chloracidobacterium sp.]
MKPRSARLRDVAIRTRLSQIVVEKDYALRYHLTAGIAVKQSQPHKAQVIKDSEVFVLLLD